MSLKAAPILFALIAPIIFFSQMSFATRKGCARYLAERQAAFNNSRVGFTRFEMQVIQKGAEQLLASVNEHDFVIILGRSPLWFGRAARILKGPKNFYEVAFSGRPYSDEYSIPTPEQIIAYRSYLAELGLSPQKLLAVKGRIVIVDHIQTGESLEGFIKILSDWIASDKLISAKQSEKFFSKLKLINFTHKKLNNWPKLHGFVYADLIEDIILAEDVMRMLINATDESSLGLYFRPSRWGELDPIDFRVSEAALENEKKLRAFLLKQYPHGFESRNGRWFARDDASK